VLRSRFRSTDKRFVTIENPEKLSATVNDTGQLEETRTKKRIIKHALKVIWSCLKAIAVFCARYFYNRVCVVIAVLFSFNLMAIFFVFAEWLLYSMIASEILDFIIESVPFEIPNIKEEA